MKRMDYFNKSQPVVQDLAKTENTKADAIKARAIDEHGWGILPSNAYSANMNLPVSALHVSPNLPYVNLEFPLRFDANLGLLSIGQGSGSLIGGAPAVGGVAENLLGERIAILLDEAFDPSNVSPYGLKSSGNLSVPMAGPAGADYFVWLEYLETNEATQRNDEDGGAHFPYINDGYKILVTTTAVSPNGDGISVFICKIHWATVTPGEILQVTRGTVNGVSSGNYVTTAAPEIVRVYRAVRDNAVEIFVDPNTGLLPAGYAFGFRGTLRDHILALGSGTPGPNNPHGLTIKDLPGGTLEPKAVQNQAESLATGIIDFNIPQSSPVEQTDVFLPTIPIGGLVPAVTLDSQATSAQPGGAGISTLSQDRWCRIKDMHQNTGQLTKGAYLQGRRIVKLYPTLKETQDHLGDPSLNPVPPDVNAGDGWVGFKIGTDPTGIYRLQGMNGVINDAEVLIVHKYFLGTAFPNPMPAVPLGIMELGYVYWNGVSGELYRDYLQAQAPGGADNLPVDRRSEGLVGPAQVSTAAKTDPDVGMLSQHIHQNLVANPNFLFAGSPGVFTGWNIPAGQSLMLPSAWVQLLPTTDATLMTGGPAALSGVRATVAGSVVGSCSAYAELGYLKPNKFYAISFDYKIPANWNVRLRAGINTKNDNTGVSVLTTGSPAGSPLDVVLKNDGTAWHRASLVVQTNASVNDGTLASRALYYLHLMLSAASANAGAISITNLCVTEGEFVTGFVPGRYIPSGGNIFFDDLSACPPGFEENVSLRGRIPVGMYPGGTNGMGVVGSIPGSPITDGSRHTDVFDASHYHTVNPSHAGGSTTGGGDTGVAGSSQVNSSAAIPSLVSISHTTGLQVGLWCRAI